MVSLYTSAPPLYAESTSPFTGQVKKSAACWVGAGVGAAEATGWALVGRGVAVAAGTVGFTGAAVWVTAGGVTVTRTGPETGATFWNVV